MVQSARYFDGISLKIGDSVIHFRPVHDSITDTCSSSLQKYNISFKRQNIWTGKWITENRPRFFYVLLLELFYIPFVLSFVAMVFYSISLFQHLSGDE